MNRNELIEQVRSLRERIQSYANDGADVGEPAHAAKAQVCEFLRQYAGPKSAFVAQAEAARGYASHLVKTLSAILDSFAEYIEAGLGSRVSPERAAQIDVVSDILEQAHSLLENDKQHPAAAAMLIGAALEEFLRTWTEAAGLSLGGAKPSIDAYAKVLRGAEMISKQDVKDITSWAGSRNHAAHGEWTEVADRGRVRLMLEGVNLFMRQRGPTA